eukprot:6143798-Prymnesium_polylepis.1
MTTACGAMSGLFASGERVCALYDGFGQGRTQSYEAVVLIVNGDGTCDIEYDDGEVEEGVAKQYLSHVYLSHVCVTAQPDSAAEGPSTPTGGDAAPLPTATVPESTSDADTPLCTPDVKLRTFLAEHDMMHLSDTMSALTLQV